MAHQSVRFWFELLRVHSFVKPSSFPPTRVAMAEAVKAAEAKKLLGESAEESRLKRLEKQQSRYRDRGG